MRTLVAVPFESDSGTHYVYDDNTGMVFPSSPSLMALLTAHAHLPLRQAVDLLRGRFDDDRLTGEAEFVRHWTEVYGAFYRPEALPSGLVERMRQLGPADIEEYLDGNGTRQLILVLTEDCNLRCRYCVYSDEYALTRSRTPAVMPVEVGRRAIDDFFERGVRTLPRNPWQRLAITFYGGEPLLAGDTLRQLVAYAEEKAPCRLMFTMTTNGTLLGGDLAGYLVDHDFRILVSLDGGHANHDRNRVFADGRGSFSTVIENLRRFRARFPAYAHVHLVTTVDWGTDLVSLGRFYEEHAKVLPDLQQVTTVAMEGTAYYDRFPDEERAAFAKALGEVEAEYYRAEKEGTSPRRVGRLLYGMQAMSLVARRRCGNGVNWITPFTGTCVPGSKIAVRVDGTYDICERVNGTMPIGHVDTGLDLNRIASMVREYNAEVASTCWTCPVTKLCGRCMAVLNRDGRFERTDEACQRVVGGARHTLRKVYSVMETQPVAFTEFRDINEDVRFVTS